MKSPSSKKFSFLLGLLFICLFMFPSVTNAMSLTTSPDWTSPPSGYTTYFLYTTDSFSVNWSSPYQVDLPYYWAKYNTSWSSWMVLSSGSGWKSAPATSGSLSGITASALGWGVGWHQLEIGAWEWINGASTWSTKLTPSIWVTDKRQPTATTIYVTPLTAKITDTINLSWGGSGDNADYYWMYVEDSVTQSGGVYYKFTSKSWGGTAQSLANMIGFTFVPGHSYNFWNEGCNTDSGGATQCSKWTKGSTFTVQTPPTSATISGATPNPVSANQTYTMKWSASTSAGNCTDCSYTINYTFNGGSQVTTIPFGSATSWTGNTPPDGVGTYSVTVTACNGDCSAANSATSPPYILTVTPPAVPVTADVTALPASGGKVHLSWTPPSGTTSCTLSDGKGFSATYLVTTQTSYDAVLTTTTTFTVSCQ